MWKKLAFIRLKHFVQNVSEVIFVLQVGSRHRPAGPPSAVSRLSISLQLAKLASRIGRLCEQ